MIPAYFNEEAYLFHNPDIAAEVAAGARPSGYHHWLHHGLEELRLGAPYARPADRAIFAPRCTRRTYGVNLFGFLSKPSGLGEVARGCRAALGAVDCPVRETDVPLWTEDAPRVAPPAEERYRINLIQQNPEMVPLFRKAYGEELLHGCYNIGYWFWELECARKEWLRCYDYVDEIWVASEFCRHAFSRQTHLPVVRMPLVIEGLERRIAYGRAHFGLPEGVFLFGYIFDVNSYVERKNPLALIAAFRREFGDSPDVRLVLKQSHGGGPRSPDTALVEEAIAGAANILVFDQEFDEQGIVSFHNVLDCFGSPHRSEGFGFNLAESMYLRKPVIATGYSGNVDFMNDRNSYPLEYRMVALERTIGPYPKGAVWAEPDAGHLQALLRRVYEDRPEREAKGAAAEETIRRMFSRAEAGRRMQARFRELGLDAPRVRRSVFLRRGPRIPALPPEGLRQALL